MMRLSIVCVCVILWAVIVYGFPTKFKLERAFPLNHLIDLKQLRYRDSLRHPVILQQNSNVVNFTVYGVSDPSRMGLYFTKIQLGSPPIEFYVDIDTGSGLSWVGYNSCDDCPRSSGLQIPIKLYDYSSSSTASLVSCSDKKCALGIKYSHSKCARTNQPCHYEIEYGDGSMASGYFVSDVIHLGKVARIRNATLSHDYPSIVFGCSTSVVGQLTESDRALDGILGLNNKNISIVSQLSSQGVIPASFSHCLVGSDNGGGILALGHATELNMVYTPFIPSEYYYEVNLSSIAVNGKTLSIDPAIFGGAVIDSGTTLAFLPEMAYEPFVTADF